MMLVKNDLALIESYLNDVIHTPYFDEETLDYVKGLLAVIRHVINDPTPYPTDFLIRLRALLWSSSKYVSGTTSREVPYEAVFALRKALRDWTSQPVLITTALRDDLDYHFFSLDVLKVLRSALPDLFPQTLDQLLVQIALPRLYRHRPLYSVALYHELGHFVDHHHGVVRMSLLLSPPSGSSQLQGREQAHRTEHFCDLVAACYVGEAIGRLLDHIAPDAPAAASHPATADRKAVVRAFLAGGDHPVITLLQDALANLGLPALQRRFVEPTIDRAFSNIRPYAIATDEELHGLLNAAWAFLEGTLQRTAAPWSTLSEGEIVRVVNDLTEKSVRNYAIQERWARTDPGS